MEHLSLHSVVTSHKKVWLEKGKKIKYTLPSVQGWHSAKYGLPSVCLETLGKVASPPSANARRSVKITTVSYRRLLTVLCRASLSVQCLPLGKAVFAECLPVSRVLLSVNMFVTESRNLPSVALSKEVFIEYAK
jgi:hypothetical protein